MATHQAVDLVAGALSELRPPSQENMTTLDEQTGKEKADEAIEIDRLLQDQKKRDRAAGAGCLGGYRAADHFRAENFTPSERTSAALYAAKTFDSSKDNLYLCGPTGSGKSHLAAIAARRSFQKIGRDWAERVITATPMQVSRMLRSCATAAEEVSVIGGLVSVDVFVVEDLGVQKDTEFLLSVLYEVINDRYQNSEGGLIVTSNLTLGELAQKMGDDRIPSRLSQMCSVFNLTGEPDHRPRSRTS